MTRPPFPAVLDSTIMATVKSCGRKAQLEFIEHWRPKDLSVHLHAGASFASGLEVARRAFWIEGKSAEDAVALGYGALLAAYGNFECPPDSAKSAERTAGAYAFYCDRFPIAGTEPVMLPGGQRAIEFSGAEPLEIPHPETGDPLLYSWRADQIINYAGGRFIEDDKTTSQLGASWSRQWDLRSQFTGYAWGCAKAGVQVDGVLVRGVSILKTKYDTAEALTYRPQWQIDRWYEQLNRDIKRLIGMWESGCFDYNLDHACAEYGGCLFRGVCVLPEPSQWLEQFFERRQWNPLTRKETKL